jgi:hypothetical protein
MLIISDVHLGNHKQNGGAVMGGVNARFMQTLQVLKQVLDDHPREAVVIAGDLFDKSSPPPAQVGQVAALLRGRSTPTYIMMGNHDHNSSLEYDFAFSPLCANPLVELVTEATYINVENLRVLLCPYPAHLPDQEINRADAAIAHAGISDGSTPAYLLSEKTLDIHKLNNWQTKQAVPFVFSGDWHTRVCWIDGKHVTEATVSSRVTGNRTIQIGALAPTGFDNQGFGYGSVWLFKKDAQGLKANLKVVSGPRFLRTESRGVADEFIAQCELSGCEPFVKFDGEYGEAAPCSNFIQNRAKVTSSKVTEAAVQLRSDHLIDKVVYEQVTAKVPAELQKEVMERVLGYLKGTV